MIALRLTLNTNSSSRRFVACCNSGKVEAAGIEPASRDIFMMASTCVVDGLFLASQDAYRQGCL